MIFTKKEKAAAKPLNNLYDKVSINIVAADAHSQNWLDTHFPEHFIKKNMVVFNLETS